MALPMLLTQRIMSIYEKLKYPIVNSNDVHEIVLTSLKLSKIAIDSFTIIRDQQRIIFFSTLALTMGVVSYGIANTQAFETKDHQQSTLQKGCSYLCTICFGLSLALLARSYYDVAQAISAHEKKVILLTSR